MKKLLVYIMDCLKYIYQGGSCLLPVFLYKNTFGKNVFIGRNCKISNSEIGNNTYMGNDCHFSNTKIGCFCSISQNVKMAIGRHPSSVFVSTSPLFYSLRA